jgi:hypothetical protein
MRPRDIAFELITAAHATREIIFNNFSKSRL